VATLTILIAAIAAEPAPADERFRILAFGDSLTAGFGLAESESFPAQLEAALEARGLAVEVINGGVSGDTSAGGLARLDWALADDPDVVIVELGANDGLRGLDPAATEANLDKILARIRAEDRHVLLAGMRAPPNLGADYEAEFNGLYPALATRHAAAFYPFFLDGVATDSTLNQPDGIHPNAAGVSVIVRHILPYVLQAIDGRGETAGTDSE
jgi:acyl-CoA thioesterase-1